MSKFESASVLRPAHEEIVAKVLDGEAVIINLETGTYYSADGVGGFIWERLDEGQTVETIATAVAARYDVDAARAAADLNDFLTGLVEEGLLVAEPGPACRAAPPAGGEAKLAYVAPRFHVYRDMEELLALDPPTPSLGDLRWKG